MTTYYGKDWQQSKGLRCQAVFALRFSQTLSLEQQDLLSLIIQAQPAVVASNIDTAFTVWPRLGNQSPWSSKALDIVHSCGLSHITHIEKGLCYSTPSSDTVQHKELFDPMTESLVLDSTTDIFAGPDSAEKFNINIELQSLNDLQKIDRQHGFALSDEEIQFLYRRYKALGRSPTLTELFMFAQVNSEHCRHKIFNASWSIDAVPQNRTLFDGIRSTFKAHKNNVTSAYSDNAAVMLGRRVPYISIDTDGYYSSQLLDVDILMKVETHNHPTAISPFPGAGTGVGGEIRDEGAVGRGSKPKAGLCGYSVSDLQLSATANTESGYIGYPDRIATAQQIMLEAPIGAAAFNNEYGRPNINGYFRSFFQCIDGIFYGYHKPIMIAGGMGNVRRELVDKPSIRAGDKLVVLGGPSMLIGIGGGSASSVDGGNISADLDFSSVQRQNPEMQRRCQEVIDRCSAMGVESPILFIHDVGAGGLSNALPELVHHSALGGRFDVAQIARNSDSMNLTELWCNEAQERYVLAIKPEKYKQFQQICARENALYYCVGEAISAQKITLINSANDDEVLFDMPMDILFGSASKTRIAIKQCPVPKSKRIEYRQQSLQQAIECVLSHPTVASKNYLITIGDRSITGQVVRDQMVGRYQVPVADYAMTCMGFDSFHGEAMAMGERAPIAIVDASASARIAVAEALTNICSSGVQSLSDIAISANWMCAGSSDIELLKLHRGVTAITEGFMQELGINIPVGKDSLSMKTRWSDQKSEQREVIAPMSLIVSAFASVADVRTAITPELQLAEPSIIVWVEMGKARMAGSILQQSLQQFSTDAPDIDATALKNLLQTLIELQKQGLILASHDRSDGGLIATLLEMAFTQKVGLQLQLDNWFSQKPDSAELIPFLFNEEIGVALQVATSNLAQVQNQFQQVGITAQTIAELAPDQQFQLNYKGDNFYSNSVLKLQQLWSQVSFDMQSKRDNPVTSQQEFDTIVADQKGLQQQIPQSLIQYSVPQIVGLKKPKIAVLREQGVNGHIEMAAAFMAAGFECRDINMDDLENGLRLDSFAGIVACGGFSFGDVLGGGSGWAHRILSNTALRDTFQQFFERDNSFSLGVCNGCQMMSQLTEIIPATEYWPKFSHNISRQFEARLTSVRIEKSPSILLSGMEGAVLSVPVAHAEGTVVRTEQQLEPLVCYRFVDSDHRVTTQYPYNPNGSVNGIASVTSTDGRHTIMMPHPERIFRSITMSHTTTDKNTYSPWMAMFNNAYYFHQKL